jgi:hypothetical protein
MRKLFESLLSDLHRTAPQIHGLPPPPRRALRVRGIRCRQAVARQSITKIKISRSARRTSDDPAALSIRGSSLLGR